MTEADVSAAVAAAIGGRRSVRGFLPRAVPEATLRQVLALASRAPSMTNTQPWKLRVLTGAARQRLVTALQAAHAAGAHSQAEYDYYPSEWVSPYLERRREIGWALYGLLGIAKGDRVAAHRQHARNYDFFGAPVGLIVTIDRVLGRGSWLDLGMFLQNVMIAARGAGLDTCPQAAFAFYADIIRAQLAIPTNELVVCGMALGFADPDEPANRLETPRAPVEAFATFLSE